MEEEGLLEVAAETLVSLALSTSLLSPLRPSTYFDTLFQNSSPKADL